MYVYEVYAVMGVLYIWEIYVLRSSLPMNVYEIYMGILIFENAGIAECASEPSDL